MTDIRIATPDDLDGIHKWLAEEENAYQAGLCSERGFLCNWRVIESWYKENELHVLLESDRSTPIAFRAGSISSPDILEVHPAYRGKGYGRQLAEHLIMQARQGDFCVLRIQCAPRTSVPFWQRMGFILYVDAFGERCGREQNFYAYKVLDKKKHPNRPWEGGKGQHSIP